MALVEELSTPVPGTEELSYVRLGQTLELPAQARLVLDYLASCTRETVTGGTVRVGERQSEVAGGHVQRQILSCAGEALRLAVYQSDVGGVATMRGMRAPTGSQAPTGATAAASSGSGRLTVETTTPALLLSGKGPVSIDRVDAVAKTIVLKGPAPVPGRRVLLDLRRERVRLQPGAVYQATQDNRRVEFQVADAAADSNAPLISRLLPL